MMAALGFRKPNKVASDIELSPSFVTDVSDELYQVDGIYIKNQNLIDGYRSPSEVIIYSRWFKDTFLSEGKNLTDGEKEQFLKSKAEIKSFEARIAKYEEQGDEKKFDYHDYMRRDAILTGQRLADETRPIQKKVNKILEETSSTRAAIEQFSAIAASYIGAEYLSSMFENFEIGGLKLSDVEALIKVGIFGAGWAGINKYADWRNDRLMEKLGAEKRRIYREGLKDMCKEAMRYMPDAIGVVDIDAVLADHKKYKKKRTKKSIL